MAGTGVGVGVGRRMVIHCVNDTLNLLTGKRGIIR